MKDRKHSAVSTAIAVGLAALIVAGGTVGYYFVSTQTHAPAVVLPTSVTVATNPSPLKDSIVVDGVTYSSPQSLTLAPGVHNITALSPTPGGNWTRYLFTGWSDGGGQSHLVTVSSSPATYTASYKTQYELAIGTNGLASPANETKVYLGGTQVGTAHDESSYTQWFDAGSTTGTIGVDGIVFGQGSGIRHDFVCWNDLSASNPRPSIAMTGPRPLTANYLSGSCILSITVTTNPSSLAGSLVVDGVSYSSPHAFSWIVGSTHMIVANSSVSGGIGTRYLWTGWSDGGGQSHLISVSSSSTTYTAIYKAQYELTIQTSGLPSASFSTGVYLGGTMVGTAYDGLAYTQWFDAGTATGTIGVDAAAGGPAGAGPGHVFANWSDSVTNNPRSSVAMTGPETFTAIYH